VAVVDLLLLKILTTMNIVRINGALMMITTDATLTSKGQTTIPKEIRDELGMKPGDRLTFTLMSDATVVMRVKNKSISELAGTLYKKGRKPVPVEQLSR
jgi:AbrB family looped-hinge helix DNA binding protein